MQALGDFLCRGPAQRYDALLVLPHRRIQVRSLYLWVGYECRMASPDWHHLVSKQDLRVLFNLLYLVTAILADLLANHGHEAYGLGTNLISAAFYVVLTVLFYYLFKPVNASLSLFAAVVSLAGCLITVLNLFRLAARVSPLLFFGPYCLLFGLSHSQVHLSSSNSRLVDGARRFGLADLS
jgi:hypothetical protein